MKKYIVSSVVVGGFLAYSLYQRTYGTQSTAIIAPKNIIPTKSMGSLQETPSATPTPTDTPAPLPSQSPQQVVSPTDTPIPSSTPTPMPNSPYKDGTYTGNPADAFYGNIQVQATISGGKLTDVKFLQYPNDRGTSIAINSQADPILAQEAIQAQSAQVDIVSGATDSSNAFVQSLQSALNQAKR